MEFTDMSKVYNVDETLIPRTQSWIVSQQKQDGSWENKDFLGFSSSIAQDKTTSTCFVAWSLASSGYEGEALSKAKRYIKSIQLGEEPFKLALCANKYLEMEGENSVYAKELVNKLDKVAVDELEDNATYWVNSKYSNPYVSMKKKKNRYGDVETTALASMAYMGSGYKPYRSRMIMNYLISQKDSMGKWSNTQSTILTLKALNMASVKLGEQEGSSTVDIIINGQPVTKMRIDGKTADLSRTIDLGTETKIGKNSVELVFNGNLSLSYQIITKYYSPWKQTAQKTGMPMQISLSYDTHTMEVEDLVNVDVSVKNSQGSTVTMMMADLGIPPGFTILEEDLETMKKMKKIFRYDIRGRQLILYLTNIDPNSDTKLRYRLRAVYPIRAKTPVSRVYDYYEPVNQYIVEPIELVINPIIEKIPQNS